MLKQGLKQVHPPCLKQLQAPKRLGSWGTSGVSPGESVLVSNAGMHLRFPMMSLLPFALIFVIMYFLILKPQQKKLKDHQELVKNIRRGDTVVTNGGLVGKVTKVVDDDQIEVEIADGVRIRQMRQMISGVRTKGEPAKDTKEETAAS